MTWRSSPYAIRAMKTRSLLDTTPQKLYVQIADLIRGRIRGGHWQVGARLPSIDAMAAEYGVAVVTVRQAVALLEDEGLLRREQGRGTFVDDDMQQRNIWLRMDSNWNALVEKWAGIQPEIVEVRDRVPCPLDPPASSRAADAYRYMKRVHATDRMPYALVEIHLAESVYRRSPRRFDRERVLEVMDALDGVRVAHATETLTIGAADVEIARHLRIPLNSPIGSVRRTLVDASNVLIYIAHIVYRGDVVRIERRLDV